ILELRCVAAVGARGRKDCRCFFGKKSASGITALAAHRIQFMPWPGRPASGRRRWAESGTARSKIGPDADMRSLVAAGFALTISTGAAAAVQAANINFDHIRQ